MTINEIIEDFLELKDVLARHSMNELLNNDEYGLLEIT